MPIDESSEHVMTNVDFELMSTDVIFDLWKNKLLLSSKVAGSQILSTPSFPPVNKELLLGETTRQLKKMFAFS